MMHHNGKRQDTDPDFFDLSQTDLFGNRVAAAAIRHHRSAHRRGINAIPEDTPNEQ